MAGHELGRRDFLHGVRTRKKPVLDADTAYRAMVIGMSVESYRTGRTLYGDAAGEKVVTEPPSA
jgi:hypothetical protein